MMVVEGVGRLDTSPWVWLFKNARVRCVKTPVRSNWINVNIRQVDWVLVWPAVESLFIPSVWYDPKSVCSSVKMYAEDEYIISISISLVGKARYG
jgi:hypothetical protein